MQNKVQRFPSYGRVLASISSTMFGLPVLAIADQGPPADIADDLRDSKGSVPFSNGFQVKYGTTSCIETISSSVEGRTISRAANAAVFFVAAAVAAIYMILKCFQGLKFRSTIPANTPVSRKLGFNGESSCSVSQR